MLHEMILAAGLSDIGCKRAANEDRLLVDREQLLESAIGQWRSYFFKNHSEAFGSRTDAEHPNAIH